MNKVVITGTNNKIGDTILNTLGEDFKTLSLNEDIFTKKNWISELYNQLDEFSPKVIFHTLEIKNGDTNQIMSVNYEFTRILSDYCFINNLKMIYLFTKSKNNVLPTNIYEWSKYTSEILVTQNGGVVITTNENNVDDIIKTAYYVLENYDDLEFNSHELNSITKRVG